MSGMYKLTDINSLQAGANNIFVFKNFQNLYFHYHVWIRDVKSIQINTYKPSIVPVVLAVAFYILSKSFHFFESLYT